MIKIHIPPLRVSEDDIFFLTKHFLEQFGEKYQKSPMTIDPGAMSLLMRYSFPGNVRQLRNLIERLVVLASDSTIKDSDLPEEIRFFDPETGIDSTAGDLGPMMNLEYKPARESF